MSNASILFVDDEPGIRATLPLILEREGFEVITAASVGEALALMNRRSFDILISDLNIGEPGDGFTVVSAMRRTQPNTVTFILTGFPDFETALRAIRAQVDDYLVKPASVPELVDSIKKRFVGRRPRRAIRIQRASDFLMSQRETILDTWIQLVASNHQLSRIPLTPKDRLELIAALFAEICEQIRLATRELDLKNREFAAHFAQARRRQGYSLQLMILENRLLQRSMTGALQNNLLALDVSALVGDLLNIGDQFSLHIEEWSRIFESSAKDNAFQLTNYAVEKKKNESTKSKRNPQSKQGNVSLP